MHDHEKNRCKQIFDAISPYLDRELDGAMCMEFTRHMEGCEPCKRYLESIRATRDTLRRMGEAEDLPEAEAEALLQQCLKTFRAKIETKDTP